MSSTQNKTIELGGQKFTVRPFTLRQLRDVMPLLDSVRGLSGTDPVAINALAGVVAVAVRRDHPEVTADTILDLQCSILDLVGAAREAAKLSGMEVQDVSPGEPEAGTANLSTS